MPVSHSRPALMGAVQALDDPGHERRMLRVGGIPDLVRLVAEWGQQVDRGRIAFGQHLAVAHPHYLRATGFVIAFLARNMREVFGLRRVGYVDQRRAVELGCPVSGLTGFSAP